MQTNSFMVGSETYHIGYDHKNLEAIVLYNEKGGGTASASHWYNINDLETGRVVMRDFLNAILDFFTHRLWEKHKAELGESVSDKEKLYQDVIFALGVVGWNTANNRLEGS